ncbi:MAG: 1-phosphofructokinase family hexose kinase [Thermomicrobiales bacterium]
MRCLTMTLNAAIDVTYVVEGFRPGAIHRVEPGLAVPGGKGNNVARVLATLGHRVVATGFVAGRAGDTIARGLRASGVVAAFARVPGESRTCLTIRDAATGEATELLEHGATIPPAAATHFLRRAAKLAADVDAVVISGSLPEGLPPDYYALVLGALRPFGAHLALDTSGEALRLGLAGRPDLLKPNQDELAALLGPLDDLPMLVARTRRSLIDEQGIGRVLVSLGARGAVLIGAGAALRAIPPPVDAVNTVGAGDALLAGFVAALGEGDDECAALARAVATGTASVLHPTGGVVDPADVSRLRDAVLVEPVA